MAASVRGEVSLMRAPPEFCRLRTFADKAVDRPGIDELARVFRDVRDLGVAFGDMNGFDAQPLCETRPSHSIRRSGRSDARVAGEIDERLLHEMRDQPRVGAVRHDCGGTRRILPTK